MARCRRPNRSVYRWANQTTSQERLLARAAPTHVGISAAAGCLWSDSSPGPTLQREISQVASQLSQDEGFESGSDDHLRAVLESFGLK